MAKVPTAPLNRISPTVEAAPSVVTADSAAFGGRSAKLLSATGTTVANAATMFDANALRFQAREDANLVRGYKVDFNSRVRNFLHNPEIDKSTGQPTGLMQRRGEGAVGITQTLDEYLTREERDISREFNPRQKALWDREYASLFTTYMNSSSTYEAAQFQAAEDTTFTATLQSDTQLAISLDPGNAQKGPSFTNLDLTNTIDSGLRDIDTYASLRGLTAAQVKLAKDEFVSNIYVGIIDRIAIDNAARAEALYEAWKPRIQAGKQAPIEKTLEITSRTELSQMIASTLFSDNTHDTKAALAKARTLASDGYTDPDGNKIEVTPKVQDDVVTRINSMIQERLRDDRLADTANATAVWTAINEWVEPATGIIKLPGPNGAIVTSAWDLQGQTIEVDGVNVKIDLGPVDGNTMRAINTAIRYAREGVLAKTVPDLYVTALGMTHDQWRAMTPAAFQTMFANNLSEADFATVKGLYQAARSTSAEKGNTLDNAKAHIANTAKRFGLKGAFTGPTVSVDDKTIYASYLHQAQELVRAESEAKGRPLTLPEIDKITRPLMLEAGRTSGWGEGKIVRQFELDMIQPAELDAENVRESLDNIEWQQKEANGKVVWVTSRALREQLKAGIEEEQIKADGSPHSISPEEYLAAYLEWQKIKLAQGLEWRSVDN